MVHLSATKIMLSRQSLITKSLGENTTFYDINAKEQITAYLDTKIKSVEEDPDKKCFTTWNDKLHRIKHLFRWLYNQRGKQVTIPVSNWETPTFAKIKEKKTKRLSPYSETEIWDRDELLSIVKYEPHIRNKAALTLFWDLDARNHEVTMLRIKHLRLRDKYGEGEVPHEANRPSLDLYFRPRMIGTNVEAFLHAICTLYN
jgi:integrase/recombinase XerD